MSDVKATPAQERRKEEEEEEEEERRAPNFSIELELYGFVQSQTSSAMMDGSDRGSSRSGILL
jgi:hypothetical protein